MPSRWSARLSPRARRAGARLRVSAVSIAQCAAAAGLSWWVARLAMLVAALAGTADALRSGERGIALTALRRARSSQPLIDELRATLTAGREVTAVERLTGSAGPPQPLPPARTLA